MKELQHNIGYREIKEENERKENIYLWAKVKQAF